jgi:hypothetical protein
VACDTAEVSTAALPEPPEVGEAGLGRLTR